MTDGIKENLHMNKEKAQDRELDTIETTSMRIPTQLNKKLKLKARELGVSQNALYLILIDLGLKAYESSIVRHFPE